MQKTMSLIKNLVKEPENRKRKAADDNKNGSDNEGDKPPRPIIKSAIDLQRLKLEKLMQNPDKPIVIPEPQKDKDYLQTVPTFVRNVMGSSAGAGSGEFHVYRHLRRKEYARQKTIQAKCMKDQLDEEFQKKLEENRKIAEEKTQKKRAKRLKKKQRAKILKNNPKQTNANDTSNDAANNIESNSDSESEGEAEQQKPVDDEPK